EIERRLLLERPRNDEALTIVKIRRRKDQPEFDFTRHRPGGVARQHVDAARLKRLEPAIGVERNVIDLAVVVEDRRRQRAAQIDVEAAPLAAVVAGGEA